MLNKLSTIYWEWVGLKSLFSGRTDVNRETVISPLTSLDTWSHQTVSRLDFGHLMRTANSLEKSPMLGKTEGRRRRGCQRMRWLLSWLMQWTWTWANFRRWWGTGRPGTLQSMKLLKSWTRQSNWTIEILKTGETLILNSGLCTLTKYLENWCLNWLYFYANCKSDIEFTVLTVPPFDQQCPGNRSPSS